jgi:hypothetical protein
MITVFKAVFERVDKNKENGNQLQSTYSYTLKFKKICDNFF